MTDQEKITAIIQAIQIDNNIILILRQGITNQLSNMQSQQLQMIMTVLGLPTS